MPSREMCIRDRFRVDDVNVAQRIHGTEFMDNIIIVKAADYPVSYTHLDVYKRQIQSPVPFPRNFLEG